MPDIRAASVEDAGDIGAIYAPIVRDTCISFELEPPSIDEMRSRIASTLELLPWLVSFDERGAINGYAYASKHRERAAYRWAADTTVYVREGSRGQGIGGALYERLLAELLKLGYFQAFAGIALPNAASAALHQALGFQPIGIYRNVGFKHGAWHDVSWWQKQLQEPSEPIAVKAFGAAQN